MPKLRINYLSRFGFECAIELERSDIKALLAEAAEVQEQMVKQSIAPTQDGRRPPLPAVKNFMHPKLRQIDDKNAIRLSAERELAHRGPK